MEDMYEEYVKNVLGIPYCDFKNVDPSICREIIIGLSQMYKRYPFFKNVLCAIENEEDFRDHANMILFSHIRHINGEDVKYLELDEIVNNYSSAYGLFFITDREGDQYYDLPPRMDANFCDYFTFIIYKSTRQCDVSAYDDLSCSPFGRMAVYHEFCHLLDNFIHISKGDEFLEIIKGHDIESEISEYATNSNKELLAEAFQFYMIGKEGELIEKIGRLVDEKYIEFTKSKRSTLTNKKYDFRRRFIVEDKREIVDSFQLDDNTNKNK